MDILEKIIAHKRQEVQRKKALLPAADFESYPYFGSTCNSLVTSLLNEGGTGIIAEFKRKSPSKGEINTEVTIAQVVTAYDKYASGISVLTDEFFFGGSEDDLAYTREIVNAPILRKDFIIDEYQVLEAKAIGASAVLLIAACLTPKEVKELALFAKRNGLEVLLEIHNESELGHITDEVDMVGVNNRNLKTFEVDINTSIQLASLLPAEKILISESGINEPGKIVQLREFGYKGFLIGELFMKTPDPALAFGNFVHQLREFDNEG